MISASRFRRSTEHLMSMFGSDGTLRVPQGNGTYDPDSGDTMYIEDTYPIKYVPYPMVTDPTSDYGLSAFKDSVVTFYVKDISVVVNETCVIEGIDGIKWSIITLNTTNINNQVVMYEATVKAHT